MLVAGRLCTRAVERVFFVSRECLDQLRECGTLTQYSNALNCVGVWQAVQTSQCSAEGSVLLCCCVLKTGKLIKFL
jgi:hypothetical protein